MALPTHRVSIFKKLGAEEWSNDWLLNVLDMDQANDVADALLEFERRMHQGDVAFTYMRISTTVKADRIFRHVPLNLMGYGGISGADGLPLFNTLRLDLSTLDSDPARKYFRLPLVEGNVANMKHSDSVMTVYNGIVTTYLLNTIALDNIVTSKGNVVTGASVHPFVQMRQLKRRGKKKAQGVQV